MVFIVTDWNLLHTGVTTWWRLKLWICLRKHHKHQTYSDHIPQFLPQIVDYPLGEWTIIFSKFRLYLRVRTGSSWFIILDMIRIINLTSCTFQRQKNGRVAPILPFVKKMISMIFPDVPEVYTLMRFPECHLLLVVKSLKFPFLMVKQRRHILNSPNNGFVRK